MPSKTKIHTVYKLEDGTRVPSVTTILGILNKPALVEWAYQCGCQGLDYKAVRDQAGEGKNLYEISQILRCGINTPYRHKAEIIKALRDKGIPVPLSWEQPAKVVTPFSQKFPRIIAMLKEGYTESEVTKELHLGHSTFYRHCAEIDKALEKRAKIPRKNPRHWYLAENWRQTNNGRL